MASFVVGVNCLYVLVSYKQYVVALFVVVEQQYMAVSSVGGVHCLCEDVLLPVVGMHWVCAVVFW